MEIPIYNMEADYAAQMKSGPHQLTPEMRQKHRELQQLVKQDLPIRDPFRKSDCDMLYRYLIARKWDVKQAAEAVRDNNIWREKDKINTILTETCEDWGDMPHFIGVDREGYPVQYNAPNSQVLVNLIKDKPKDVLVRRHFIAMERARYLCKKHNADRISCVVDLTNVGMNGITQVVSFLKEMGTYDQKYYPETMRRMIVCNGGWAITGAWKGIKNFIDPRTQQKISFVSGPPSAKVLSEFIDPSQIPRKYGGVGDETALSFDFSQFWNRPPSVLLPSRPKATPTTIVEEKREAPIAVEPKSSPRDVREGTSRIKVPMPRQERPQQLEPPEGAVVTSASSTTNGRAPVVAPPAVVKGNFESPRMPEEECLGEASLALTPPPPSDAVEDGEDSDTFYSMPSTDDDRDDELEGMTSIENHSEIPVSSQSGVVGGRGGSIASPMSPSIIIHAANMCDQAIIDAERENAARRLNPVFHQNPSSAAFEALATERPRSFPNHSSKSNLLSHTSPDAIGTGSILLTNGVDSSPTVVSMPIGRQPVAPTSRAARAVGEADRGSVGSPALSPASTVSLYSYVSPSAPSAEIQMYRKLTADKAPFTITIGYCDGCFTASVGGVLLGRKMENVIMSGESDTLLMTLQREAGHPVHVHHMLITPRRQVRYVLRKGRVKDEIKVLDIHGDRTVTSVKDKGRVDGGEKIEKYNITQWPHTKDPRDWLVWRKGVRQGEEFFMWKQGREVEVTAKMLLDGNTPETVISIVLALTSLWYSPCSEF